MKISAGKKISPPMTSKPFCCYKRNLRARLGESGRDLSGVRRAGRGAERRSTHFCAHPNVLGRSSLSRRLTVQGAAAEKANGSSPRHVPQSVGVTVHSLTQRTQSTCRLSHTQQWSRHVGQIKEQVNSSRSRSACPCRV